MSEDSQSSGTKKAGERAVREERLAKALRENLRKRKEQARAHQQRRLPETSPKGEEPPA
jgi:hypothetical protein